MKKELTLEEFVSSQSRFSRRDLLGFIKEKKVFVNGQCVDALKMKINSKKDIVKVDGERIEYRFGYLYYKFYKPKGMLSTMDDPTQRGCIGDVIRRSKMPLFPVGRLDRLTTGLIFLTNDGDFSHQLMHPSKKVIKGYRLTLDEKLSKNDYKRLEMGVILEDGPARFLSIEILSDLEYTVTISEGRNRIIRRIFSHLGYDVKSLKRQKIGNIDLKGMKLKDLKPLTKKEINQLIS
ncbi:rRNA pseudouridine synthase [Candidatus Marinamargulisbacteria bacterium SCGC AG-343-D04]|nr:rRNA pseudouridine synthase [Candidatus Marinamargulisbacteria bacterium SCGC AG-343-D04]